MRHEGEAAKGGSRRIAAHDDLRGGGKGKERTDDSKDGKQLFLSFSLSARATDETHDSLSLSVCVFLSLAGGKRDCWWEMGNDRGGWLVGWDSQGRGRWLAPFVSVSAAGLLAVQISRSCLLLCSSSSFAVFLFCSVLWFSFLLFSRYVQVSSAFLGL